LPDNVVPWHCGIEGALLQPLRPMPATIIFAVIYSPASVSWRGWGERLRTDDLTPGIAAELEKHVAVLEQEIGKIEGRS